MGLLTEARGLYHLIFPIVDKRLTMETLNYIMAMHTVFLASGHTITIRQIKTGTIRHYLAATALFIQHFDEYPHWDAWKSNMASEMSPSVIKVLKQIKKNWEHPQQKGTMDTRNAKMLHKTSGEHPKRKPKDDNEYIHPAPTWSANIKVAQLMNELVDDGYNASDLTNAKICTNGTFNTTPMDQTDAQSIFQILSAMYGNNIPDTLQPVAPKKWVTTRNIHKLYSNIRTHECTLRTTECHDEKNVIFSSNNRKPNKTLTAQGLEPNDTSIVVSMSPTFQTIPLYVIVYHNYIFLSKTGGAYKTGTTFHGQARKNHKYY